MDTHKKRANEMRTLKNKRSLLTGMLVAAVFFTVNGGVILAQPGGHSQTICPILGGEIDKSAYVDHAGKRVYFCCSGCKTTFMKAPDKYIHDMEAAGVTLEEAPGAGVGDKHHHGEDAGSPRSGMGRNDHGGHGGSMH